MNRYFPLCLIFVSAVAAAQPGSTCDPDTTARPDSAVSDRLRALIKEKKFGAVQDELNDRLKRYERGVLSDMQLYRDISAAVKADVSMEPLLAQWVSGEPASYFARLMKGMHHISVGYAKRGGEVADKTSVEQLGAMEVEFKKAVSELQAARNIRPASALANSALMTVANAVAGPSAVKGLLAEAEKLDPLTMAARYLAITTLNPKWGGTFEDLDEIVVRAQSTALPAPQLRYLQYQVEMEKAGFLDVFAKEKTKAISHYRLAAALCPGSPPWSKISSAANTIQDWNTVREAATQILSLHPKSAKDMQMRGWASEKLGKMDAAVQDYQGAAELGEAWSQNKLGYLYMTGTGVAKDLPRAKTLLESAVAKGVPTALANLEWVNRQLGIK
jgi:hypothetical protein